MKKMRKLLPALAMLLVSAIMMSTASFAWFTMNETVTATGMQVQAKATGSLIIDKNPLTYASAATEVDLETGVKKLMPIHLAIVENAGQWQVPGAPQSVDPITGKITGTDSLVAKELKDSDKDGYFFDNEVYIGSAGDALAGDLQITLSAPTHPAEGTAHKAYSVAIYIMTSLTDTPSITAKPDAIIHVDTAKVDGVARNVATIDLGDVKVPSIVGVGDQNTNTTGLKVVIRVFVDGDLESVGDDKVEVVKEYKYTQVLADSKYNPNKQYFVQKVEGDVTTYIPAVVPDDYTTSTTLPNSWYTSEAVTEDVLYKYINSNDVPTAASMLSVEFKLIPESTEESN